MQLSIEQIAIKDHTTSRIRHMFELMGHNFVGDIASARGVLRSIRGYEPVSNVAVLNFNYDWIKGKEFELIYYIDGPNYCESITPGNVSHMGVHVESIALMRTMMRSQGYTCVQEVVTTNHTSPAVQGKRYHYAIYQNNNLGFYTKLIERLLPNDIVDAQKEMEEEYCCDIF